MTSKGDETRRQRAAKTRSVTIISSPVIVYKKAVKLFLRLFLLAVIALPVGVAVAGWLCFQDAPLIARKAEISVDDIERAKRILAKHDPRKAKDGMLRTIVLSQYDVDLVLNYAASQLRRGSTRVALQPGVAVVQASLEMPGNPAGRWLNVDAALHETAGLPGFDYLLVGSLPVPSFIADRALAWLAAHLGTTAEGRLAHDVVKSVRISDARVQVVYEWRDDIPDRLRAALLPPADEARIKTYSDRLVEVTGNLGAARSVSLSQLLPPMFALAQERAAAGDPARENRAAIVALAFYANGRGLSAVIPAAKTWRRPAQRSVTLDGREDFPKHFLISAAIAAEAGSPLADAIGLYKEVEDSRGGSGFSFNDIAADRAGTRFGELAVKAPGKLQAALAAGVKERDFMPDVSDLPEFMPEAEFKKRYGGIGAPRYQKMMADIETRVGSSALFR